MEGIQSVRQLDDTHVQWVAEIRGKTSRWTSEITEQQPDKKVAWKTIDGEVKNDGVVSFEPIAGGQTRVNVQMDVEGESTVENVAADLLGVVKRQVRGDLERFKQLIENRDDETGGLAGRGPERPNNVRECGRSARRDWAVSARRRLRLARPLDIRSRRKNDGGADSSRKQDRRSSRARDGGPGCD
jgi:hypothetical protein